MLGLPSTIQINVIWSMGGRAGAGRSLSTEKKVKNKLVIHAGARSLVLLFMQL